MSTLTSYKQLQVVTPTPSGAGGLALNDNFTALADSIGPCNYTATTNPTTSDNQSTGYYAGSRWFNTSTNDEFVCISSTMSTAVWEKTTGGNTAPTLQQVTDAGATTTDDVMLANVTLASGKTLSVSVIAAGTITAGSWQGSVISPTYGGTGVNNGSNSLTLAGNLTTSGAYALSLTLSGATALTLPAVTDTVTTNAATQTLTNKTINGVSNTLSSIPATATVGTALVVTNSFSDVTNSVAALANIAGVGSNGQNAIYVPASSATGTVNGNALLTAYTAATSLTPYGSALSATNRAVILLLGLYDLGTQSLNVSAQYVDFAGLGNPEDTVITSACAGSNTGTFNRTVNDIRVANLTLRCTNAGSVSGVSSDPAAYYVATSNTFTLGQFWRVNFVGTNNGWGMRLAITCGDTGANGIAGYSWCWCVAAIYNNNGYGGFGSTASGTFLNCNHTLQNGCGFGGGGGNHASGTFINCTNTEGGNGFGGGAGTASGTFINCTDVVGGGFGGNGGTANGTFNNCTDGGVGFGGNSGTASGTFANCTGGSGSFGGSSGTASGKFINCRFADYWNTTFSGTFEDSDIKATTSSEAAIKTVATGAKLKNVILYSTGTTCMGGTATIQSINVWSNVVAGTSVTINVGSITVNSSLSLQ